MRVYNQKIEEALVLINQKKVKEAADHLSVLVEGEDKRELSEYIETILIENLKEKPETRESLKTFMGSISWRISQGFGYR
ncbi:MAG TPA: hypothetical protein VNZ49_14700 [Bacteroidia bacterium]|jgi:hypothetical protein|nr:hypothetical protein [Bacteroidia bacterium]